MYSDEVFVEGSNLILFAEYHDDRGVAPAIGVKYRVPIPLYVSRELKLAMHKYPKCFAGPKVSVVLCQVYCKKFTHRSTGKCQKFKKDTGQV